MLACSGARRAEAAEAARQRRCCAQHTRPVSAASGAPAPSRCLRVWTARVAARAANSQGACCLRRCAGLYAVCAQEGGRANSCRRLWAWHHGKGGGAASCRHAHLAACCERVPPAAGRLRYTSVLESPDSCAVGGGIHGLPAPACTTCKVGFANLNSLQCSPAGASNIHSATCGRGAVQDTKGWAHNRAGHQLGWGRVRSGSGGCTQGAYLLQ